MTALLDKLQRLFRDESGPTAVEYAVMIMLVILVCLTGITLVGQSSATRLENSNTAIEKAIDAAP
jgi:pilus assembly protein Flp/PilA